MKRTSWQIQRAVIFALVVRELQSRFGGRMVGLLWVLFEPILNIAVILAVRVVLRERFSGVMMDTATYMTVAMLPFFTFRNIWFRVMDGANANLGLFGYRQVKPFDAFVARAIIEIALYVLILILMMSAFGWYGYEFLPRLPLEYMGVWILFIVIGFGMGLISAVVGHEYPAFRGMIRLISLPLYLLSGVILPVSSLPEALQPYLLWNPMLHLVELSRWAYFPSYHPMDEVNAGYPTNVAFIVIGLGVALYRVRRMQLLTRPV